MMVMEDESALKELHELAAADRTQALRELTSNLLPPQPLIRHQGHATVELHDSFGRDGFALDHIQMEAVMQRDDLATHARCDHSGLSFDLNGFILPDNEVADLEAEGFILPGVHCLIIAGVADGCLT